MVSSSIYASTNKDGSCPGWAHSQVSLVCSLVPPHLLLAPSITGPWPLAGRLASNGWCWGSFFGCYPLHCYGKCDAGSQPPSSAHQAPDLGLLAQVDALSQATWQLDHQSNCILQLHVRGGSGRGGRRGAHLNTNVRQHSGRVCSQERTVGL